MSKKTATVITLLTDFGEEDWFVGSMKGVILALCPRARFVDITHDVPPGDVNRASWILKFAYRFFPPETIHLIVVDPGVGTDRPILLLRGGGHTFLAPDNGVLTRVLGELPGHSLRQVSNPRLFLNQVSQTFQGRDIFAPVAARLAGGLRPKEVGPACKRPRLLPAPVSRRSGRNWEGTVVCIDHFGNLITSISRREADRFFPKGSCALTSRRGRAVLPLVSSYGAAETRRLLAIWGSCGYLELAVNGGSAERRLRLKVGDRFLLKPVA